MIVIVAHRLSTVKEADQILVLDEGVIVEKGDHDFLLKSEGVYSQLIKNQRG
jgi:ATP-binding cassette subfamily B protein